MSAELSRRVAKVVLLEPIRSLPPRERRGIADAADDAHSFEDIPQHYQRMICEAESELQRLIAAKREGAPA
jgi:hypothetical protein